MSPIEDLALVLFKNKLKSVDKNYPCDKQVCYDHMYAFSVWQLANLTQVSR